MIRMVTYIEFGMSRLNMRQVAGFSWTDVSVQAQEGYLVRLEITWRLAKNSGTSCSSWI